MIFLNNPRKFTHLNQLFQVEMIFLNNPLKSNTQSHKSFRFPDE